MKTWKKIILFTSDVHCGIDSGFGYAGVQQVRDRLEDQALMDYIREGRSAANTQIPTARAESRSSTGERRKRDGHDYTKVVYYNLICTIKPKRSEDP